MPLAAVFCDYGQENYQKEYRLVNADTVRHHRNSPQSAGVELLIIACFSLENLKNYRTAPEGWLALIQASRCEYGKLIG